jgi:AraC family transcriptional activator of tynA and feaB
VFTWSTDAVDARDWFSFWREVICNTALNVSTEAPSPQFRARISARTFGALRFASYATTSHEIVRSKEHVERATDDGYVISLQLTGHSRIVQGDEVSAVGPNEIVVVDGARPFRIGLPEPVRRIIAVMPRHLIDTRAPWLCRAPRSKIVPGAPFAALIRRHLLELAVGRHSVDPGEANLLAENLCNLLALATGRDVPSGARPPELQRTALLAFVRQNLANPELSPRMVAAHFDMSVRTLHSRFEQLGHTFGHWVLGSRLDGCAEALRDPRQPGFGISDLAYRWGFNDLSHFNKAFRARFAMTPGQWRHAGLSRRTGSPLSEGAPVHPPDHRVVAQSM